MSKEEVHTTEPLAPRPTDKAEEICYPDGRIEHTAVSHEPSDIRFRPILALMALACAILAVVGYTHLAILLVSSGCPRGGQSIALSPGAGPFRPIATRAATGAA